MSTRGMRRAKLPKTPHKPPGARSVEVDQTVARHFGIDYHEGYASAFSRHQYERAKFKNGTRIVKAVMEEGDTHAVGSLGTVLGSIGAPGMVDVGYYVEWDEHPRSPVLVIEAKIDKAP